MNAEGNAVPFPSAQEPAVLSEWSYTAERMASAPTITGSLMHRMCLDDLWSKKEYVEFNGERYFIDQTPTSSKSTDDVRYSHEITLTSERIVLENVYFFDVVTSETEDQYKDRYRSNGTTFSIYGTLQEFVARLNDSLIYTKLYDVATSNGYQVVIDEEVSVTEEKEISLENVYFAAALQEIYTKYEVPYYWTGKTCHVGYAENSIAMPFEYGQGNGLLSVTKTNDNYRIINRITGKGSSDNIPHYYPNKAEDRDDPANGGVWITPTGSLMPPIYRESNGGERFYNAQNDTYDNPDGGKYIFHNPYTESNPMEGIQDFEYIKPSIKGMKNAMGQLLGEIADIAFDSDDSDEVDDNGDYVHSYFYVKLHIFNGKFGFNLFKQALAQGGMTFNMTSGNCARCAFEVGVSKPKLVDGHYEFENPVQVDENGDIVSGSYSNKVNFNNIQPRQQDTSAYEVWVALKKEIDTFGVVMPNATNNYKPSVGDTFVITNILMPYVYITSAENELKEALIKCMSENNDEKFSFNITLSRIYLQQNPDIASMLNENARLIVRYNEHDYTLYVSSYSCKATDDILYEITVDVTSEFSVGQSALRDKIAEVAHEVIGGGKAALDYLALAQKYFLSKRQRDRARGKIIFEEGIEIGGDKNGYIDGKANAELLTLIVRDLLKSPNFRDGFDGEGWRIWMEDALSHLTIDRLTVRRTLTAFEYLIMKVRSVGGQIAVSAANGKIKSVTRQGDIYFITFEDGCDFMRHDLMRCATWKGGKEQHAYWVEIAGVTAGVAWVLASEFEGVEPMVGDECVLMGNTENPLRQNMILISATEDGKPRIDVMDGINKKSFTGCLRARLGNLDRIDDSWFPASNQPHGDGLYADNAYLRGTFLLSTGEDIKTKFEIVEGMISSAVESVRQDFAEGEGFLSNPLFADGFNHWSAKSDTGFLTVGNSWIWANGGILSKQGDGAVLSVDRDRTVVNIKNTSIVQKAADYYALPEIETNADGKKEAASVYLSFLYKVRKAGRLSVRFEGLDKTGFENFSPLNVRNMALEETEDYRQFTRSGLWNGTGDFTLRFTGEISVCMIVLSTDEVAALTSKYSTLVEQTDTVVRIVAQNFDKDGNVLADSQIITTTKYNALISERFNDDGSIKNTSGLVTTAEGSGIYAQITDEYGNKNTALIGIAVEEDDGNGGKKTVIKLTSDNIQLEGYTTINNNFIIDENGKLHAVDGEFSGRIVASSGKIGLFTIDNEGLYYGEQNKWYDGNYKQNLAYITPGAVRIQNEVGVFGEGDVANIKVAFGDYADPSLEVDDDGIPLFNFRGCSAGYIYRQSVSLPPYEYFPAVKIISDNAIGRDVALYTKGAIVCQGGLWGAACIMDVGTGSGEYNVIAPDKGSTILLRNPGGARLYMPKLAEMKRMMQTDGAFAVPLRLVSLNGNGITTMFFNDGESKTNFLRTTGDSQGFIQLSSCNTVDILLIYNGTDDFYAIVK